MIKGQIPQEEKFLVRKTVTRDPEDKFGSRYFHLKHFLL